MENSIQFYVDEVDKRIAVKREELEKTLQKAEIVAKNSETISHFVGKWDKFEIRVKEFQQQIAWMDEKIEETREKARGNSEFSKSEEIQLNKLFEQLEKLTEERKSKEQILLKLMEEEAKPPDSSDDSC